MFDFVANIRFYFRNKFTLALKMMNLHSSRRTSFFRNSLWIMLVWAIGIGVGISLVAVAILGTSFTYNHCMVNFCAFYEWLGGGSVAIILGFSKDFILLNR